MIQLKIKKQTEDVIIIIFICNTDPLTDGNQVEIRGFGSFCFRERNARTAHNPKSGELVDVPNKIG